MSFWETFKHRFGGYFCISWTLRHSNISNQLCISNIAIYMQYIYNDMILYLSISVFFRRHWRFKWQQRKKWHHLYSPLPIPLAYEYSNIYLELCMWDDYYSMRFITLLNHQLIDWWLKVNFCLFAWWFISILEKYTANVATEYAQ